MEDNERARACFINISGWPWEIYDRFQLEREDVEVIIPILKHHIFHHTPYDKDNKFWKLYDDLNVVIDDPHATSYKATREESELIQTALGDFL